MFVPTKEFNRLVRTRKALDDGGVDHPSRGRQSGFSGTAAAGVAAVR